MLIVIDKIRGPVLHGHRDKVDKVPGKGLSANDFTDENKQLLIALGVRESNNYYLDRANHTGTQKAETISDLDEVLNLGDPVVYFENKLI